MTNYFYAQLDEQNICIGVSSLSGEISESFMIPISEMDQTVLGKRYDRLTGAWTEIAPEPPLPYEPTQMDRIESKVDFDLAISYTEPVATMSLESELFLTCKKWYDMGLWNINKLNYLLANNKITQEEYDRIINQ